MARAASTNATRPSGLHCRPPGRALGGFGTAEGLGNQQLTVLREAGFDMIMLQDAGRDQGGWSVADGPTLQLAVLLRKYGNDYST